jgi:membrane protein
VCQQPFTLTAALPLPGDGIGHSRGLQEGELVNEGSPALTDSRPTVGSTIKRALRAVAGLFKETLDTWGPNEPDVHAAAIAFATLFSLAPLVMLVLVMVGQTYQQQFLDNLIVELASRIGQDPADLLGGMIASRGGAQSGQIAAAISFVVLVFSAASLVGILRASLNSMWNLTARVQSDVRRNVYVMVMQLIVPSAMVLAFGLALSGLLIINTLGNLLYEQYLRPFLAWFAVPAPEVVGWPAPIGNFLIFVAMFRVLPSARIRWRDVLPGAALTALLFWLGTYAIQMYLAYLFTVSVYGAAGSIIVVLLWVDYSALIILFGAEFTYVYAKTYGVPIVPDPDMVFKPGTNPNGQIP